jgi:hypothetical protein
MRDGEANEKVKSQARYEMKQENIPVTASSLVGPLADTSRSLLLLPLVGIQRGPEDLGLGTDDVGVAAAGRLVDHLLPQHLQTYYSHYRMRLVEVAERPPLSEMPPQRQLVQLPRQHRCLCLGQRTAYTPSQATHVEEQTEDQYYVQGQ